jgi:hypothetical protein
MRCSSCQFDQYPCGYTNEGILDVVAWSWDDYDRACRLVLDEMPLSADEDWREHLETLWPVIEASSSVNIPRL